MISTDTGARVTDDGVGPRERSVAFFREPRAVSLAWLGGYLAASGIALSAGGHGRLAALHAAAILVIAWCGAERGATARVVGDLFPLIVAPLLYGEIPQLIASTGTSYHDAMVQRWEVALFGTQAARTFAGAVPYPLLSEILHAGYLAYYAMIFAPPLLLYVRGQRRAFAETVLALTVIFTSSWVLFVLMPVEGPRYLWGAPTGVPDGLMRRLAVQVLGAGSSRGAAFPSSHMAVMVGQTLMAFRWQPRVGWLLATISTLVGLGAVYGGFHYATDMVAGAILGGVCAAAVLQYARADEGRGR
jgi:membrane-associated phospholipid phosphatase